MESTIGSVPARPSSVCGVKFPRGVYDVFASDTIVFETGLATRTATPELVCSLLPNRASPYVYQIGCQTTYELGYFMLI